MYILLKTTFSQPEVINKINFTRENENSNLSKTNPWNPSLLFQTFSLVSLKDTLKKRLAGDYSFKGLI